MNLPARKYDSPVVVLQVRRKDPTRTATLRRQWVRDVDRRFAELNRNIRYQLVDLDVLGLRDGGNPVAMVANYSPLRPEERLQSFMRWLEAQEKKGVLEIVQRPTGLEPWTNTYITSSYQKGLADAHAKLRASGVDVPSAPVPGSMGGAVGAFHMPFHADRASLMYQRVFTDLKGVTEAMNTRINRVLTQGMVRGASPMEMARQISREVKTTGINRARTIARTEVIHVHNLAALNEYGRFEGVVGEEIYVKWLTAGDPLVRDTHDQREGKIFQRSYAVGLLGEPNCRCALLPHIQSIHGQLVPQDGFVPGMNIVGSGVPYFLPEGSAGAEVTGTGAGARAGARAAWTEINSMSEMEAAYAERFNVKSIGHTGYPREVDALKKFNALADELTILLEEHPIVAEWMAQKPLKRLTLTYDYHLGRFGHGKAAGLYRRSEETIALATRGFRSTRAQSLAQGEWTVGGTSLRAVFRHELGHHLQGRASISAAEAGGDTWLDFHLTSRHGSIWWEKNVSNYSATNQREAFAESFAFFTHPEYGTTAEKTLPSEVAEWMKGAFKK